MNELPTGTRATLALDQIKPYWRNPRRISDEAITALSESIRNYEYQQPIVVDSDHVIIVGHTRYSALRRLGVETVDVLVADHLSEKQAAEWRVIDNRTSELSDWNFDALDDELAGMSDRVASFFPETATLETGPMFEGSGGVAALMDNSSPLPDEEDDSQVELVCPSCFHLWETTVTNDDLANGINSTIARN